VIGYSVIGIGQRLPAELEWTADHLSSYVDGERYLTLIGAACYRRNACSRPSNPALVGHGEGGATREIDWAARYALESGAVVRTA
jgi:hypothetical protein